MLFIDFSFYSLLFTFFNRTEEVNIWFNDFKCS